MNDLIAINTFLPWLRKGIANNIQSPDLDTSVKLRADIDIHLQLEAQKVDGGTLTEDINKTIKLYGPGDIVGIDSTAIVRNEPRNWITNFETNYLPYVEFYDEDFPWRYTAAAPDTDRDRLRPWITLVVLSEDEFTDGKNIQNKLLPYIEVENASSLFPPAGQLWAWAHVHVNEGLIDTIEASPSDTDEVLDNLKTMLNNNPDFAYSRLFCPRKLKAVTGYHAFVIPTFESGRLAGLGLDINDTPYATASAWDDYEGRSAGVQFPYYHRWYFKTGTIGDFEYLVRLLEPQPMDSRVGRRDMDVQDPGSNIAGITDEDLGGILKLGGALQIPFDTLPDDDQAEVTKYNEWYKPYPHVFQEDLAQFINLADDYAEKTAEEANADTELSTEIQNNKDPLITSPLYGRWHALVQRLLKKKDGSALPNNENWVHDLNLDPRYRVAAGFGTRVVQEFQEKYMQAAWEQVGDILEANRKLRFAQLAKEVSFSWYHKYLEPLVTNVQEIAIKITAPVQNRVIAKGLTVAWQLKQSKIPAALNAAPMRQILRSGSRVMKYLQFNDIVRIDNLLTRINNDDVVVAPPKVVPPALSTVDELAEDVLPDNAPDIILDWLRKYPVIKYIPLVLAVIILLFLFILSLTGASIAIGIAIVAGLVQLYRTLQKWTKQIDAAHAVKDQDPQAVDEYPKSPDFRISKPEEDFTPTTGNTDSAEAINYKAALKDAFRVMDVSSEVGKITKKPRLDISVMAEATFTGVDPEVTIPRFTYGSIYIPDRIKAAITEDFVEAMAYPVIDDAMYEPLVDISPDMFLPNINYVPQNSISLLETNQEFIESYMVGLNHEFARELLWREYMTDQRGSYFRQFWDVSSFYDDEGTPPEELKEKLRDIPPLHLWSKTSDLGDHDHRETGGENEKEVVLVIRGELLKKYPNAVIYAHRAAWKDEEGHPIVNGDSEAIDLTQERALWPLMEEQQTDLPRSLVKTPLYEARVYPDITFFGFDLTVCEAKGGTGDESEPVDEQCAGEGITWDDAGWFFVIKERPGEPRFGLDIGEGNVNEANQVEVWNDLSWADILPGEGGGEFIQITEETVTITADQDLDPDDDEKIDQQGDDEHIEWNKDMNAADVAYILNQVPVLVAVHAAEMLPEEN